MAQSVFIFLPLSIINSFLLVDRFYLQNLILAEA